MISISYGDIAVGAKEQSTASMVEIESFVDLGELKRSLALQNYASIGELNNVILDGKQQMFPTEPEIEDMGLWSNVLSEADGSFSASLTFQLEERITTTGLTFVFDRFTGCYCNDLNIKWYSDDDLLAEEQFFPNAVTYSCEKVVTSYNKIVIVFNKLNLPFFRLRIFAFDFGVGRLFTGENIYNANIIEEVNLASDGISINTFDFNLISSEGVELAFQRKQPLEVRVKNKLLGLFFVQSSSRQQVSGHYIVKAEDFIGLLDGYFFEGGLYNGVYAATLIQDICDLAGIPVEFDAGLINEKVWGHLPYLSAREALARICLAINAFVDTSRRDKIYIAKFNESVQHEYSLEDVLGYQDMDEENKITGLEVEVYRLTQDPNAETVVLYEAQETVDGIANIVFEKPATNLSITNGTILSSTINNALIEQQEACVLTGKLLAWNSSIIFAENTQTIQADVPNIVKTEPIGLRGTANQNLIEQLSKFYFLNKKLKQKLVVGDIKVGEKVIIPTQFSGLHEGWIESLRYTITGGEIIADAEVLIDDN